MLRFKNILATVDTRFEKHPALEWAIRLAEHNQSKLKLVDVVPEFSWTARLAMPDHQHIQKVLRQEKGRALEVLAAPIRDNGIDVTTRVLSAKTSFQVMREVLRDGHDLVVRVTKGTYSRQMGFVGTTSKRLLRKCPCPVWLVHSQAPARFDRVLAAVDLGDPEEDQERLNSDIMNLASSIAQYEDGQCHVCHAWKLFADAIMRPRLGPKEFQDLLKTTESQVASEFDKFLAPYRMSQNMEGVHLLNGDPAPAIVELVKKQNIDLIVMGTIARTGIPGMLMGNTAERLLDRVECSILAIKPDGYFSPVMWDKT